jgi:hypothetical protein
MAVVRTEYRETNKRNMPKWWFDNLPRTHRALDDAIGRGALFCNILAERKRQGLSHTSFVDTPSETVAS